MTEVLSTLNRNRTQPGLCVVALPIGNPADLSPRARAALMQADVIAAEDTRVFQAFLARSQIQTKPNCQILSYHNHNERESAPELLRKMKLGEAVALVSDAGTPNISDPGFRLLQSAFQDGIPVTGVPGPSSITLTLSVCPLGGNSFSFHGFLPAESGPAITLLQSLKGVVARAVFFVTPHRLIEDFKAIGEAYGDPQLFIGRELTKTHEEFLYLSLKEARIHFQAHAPRGEMTLAIAVPEKVRGFDEKDTESMIRNGFAEGMTARDLRVELADKTSLSRQELYALIERMKKENC